MQVSEDRKGRDRRVCVWEGRKRTSKGRETQVGIWEGREGKERRSRKVVYVRQKRERETGRNLGGKRRGDEEQAGSVGEREDKMPSSIGSTLVTFPSSEPKN